MSSAQTDLKQQYGMESSDIGALLFEHENVSEVYVTRFELTDKKETLCAFVVPTASEGLTEKELHEYCAQRMPGNTQEIRIKIIEEIPRNPMGTVERDKLRIYAEQASAKEVA